MSEHIRQEQVKVLHKTYTIKIFPDEMPLNPREDCDNLGTIIYWHRNYSLGEIDGRKENIDALEFARQKSKKGAVIVPVYLYDHSGITINTTGFSCRWDSGQVGWIFADKEEIRKWFEIKNITKKLRDTVREHLIREIEIFDKYICGDVYEFQIEDEDGNDIDSCGGFYSEKECIEEAKNNIPSEQDILDDLKKQEAKQDEAIANLVGIS